MQPQAVGGTDKDATGLRTHGLILGSSRANLYRAPRFRHKSGNLSRRRNFNISHSNGASAGLDYRDVMTMPASANDIFQHAMAALRAGRMVDAESAFKSLLKLEPKHVAALNLLSVVLTQRGKFEEAEHYVRRALKENSRSDATFYNYGIILKALYRPAEALERFGQALALNPAVAETWNNRGTVFNELARYREAVADFDRAIAIDAKFAPAYYNKGKALAGLELWTQALVAFDRSLELDPALAEAWGGRGEALLKLNRYDEAVAAYDQALALNPDSAGSFLGRGNLLVELGRPDEASDAYDRALALKPDLAQAWLGRGNIFADSKRFEDASAAYDKAIELTPALAEAWLGRANIIAHSKRFEEASTAYDKALELKPTLAEAWVGRANILTEMSRFDEALIACEKALALEPDLAEAWQGQGNLFLKKSQIDAAGAAYGKALHLRPDYAEAWIGSGIVFVKKGQPGDAVAAYDKALTLKPDLEYVEGIRLLAKMQLCDWTNFEAEESDLLTSIRGNKLAAMPLDGLSIATSAADQYRYAKIYVADHPAFPPLWRDEIYKHDRIRVAYVSSDLRNHPVGAQLVNLLERHDRSRFEITAVSLEPDQGSDTQRRIKAAVENFVDAKELGDREIADLIRQREIDIVIDLNGHTEGRRPNVFAQKPSPIQVNYLGYAGTLGADYCDYILADKTVIPEDQIEFYSEKVVWLPGSFMASDSERRISEIVPSRAECGLPESGFVFCCFNGAQKISPSIFQIWTRLLQETPGSVLWLRAGDSAMMANLRREIETAGLATDRLIFAPKIDKPEDHLARLRQADLFLDTLPYNAHATASDALWAGLPVLTCLGSTFAGRVAASQIKAVGLDELVTSSPGDYEAMALKLAREPDLLATLKAKLARNRNSYPLFDTARFARHIESAYGVMWQRYQQGLGPASFSVDAAG
ncbi:MAG: tetratricopeptide repeat protein [Pseudolabrys sp.]